MSSVPPGADPPPSSAHTTGALSAATPVAGAPSHLRESAAATAAGSAAPSPRAQPLRTGDLVDIHDPTTSTWVGGRITRVDGDLVEVSHGAKVERLSSSSARLTPSHSHPSTNKHLRATTGAGGATNETGGTTATVWSAGVAASPHSEPGASVAATPKRAASPVRSATSGPAPTKAATTTTSYASSATRNLPPAALHPTPTSAAAVVSVPPTPAPVVSAPPPQPPTMTDSELKKFRQEIKVGDLIDFQNSRRDRWSVGEVARVQSNLIPFSSPTLEIFNYTTNERETISRDSSRIMPPMTMSAMPAATPPPAATSRAAPVTHATTSTTSRARAGNGNTVAVSPASVTAPPTVATTPASNLSSAAHAPTTPAAHSSSAVPVSASTTAAAPAVQPVPAEPVPVPVSPLGVADPTLISGHGYTLDHGDSCDCLDTEQKWRLAEITAVEPTHVLVHYVHWSPKWDEWIPRSDRRLQPPRTKTEGYTGPINKNPAVVRPPVAPQPPPRPSYTCLAACSWKRVLSTGLSHKEIQALNELFAQCAYVQDSYEEVLMGKLGAAPATPPSAYAGYNTWQPPSAPVFRHTLDTVTALLGKLDESIASATATLPPLCHFPITQCASMAANIRGLILDAEETRRRQLLAAQEDAYMSKLNRQFRIVDISADGSCLFSAVGIGAKIKRAVGATNEEKKASGVEEKPVAEAGSVETTQQQEADAKVVSHSAPTPDAATPDPLIVLSLLRDASDLKLQHAVSSECRSDVIAFLRARLSPSDVASSDASAWSKKIATEVREVVVQESAGKYSDATSKAVWEELKGPAAAAGVPSPLALADTNDAIEAYLKVMATDGIYGTSLEVDALSDMLRTPIHLFYRSESDSSQSSVAAAESGITAEQVVGAQYPGPPICLAYYMGNKHYNLLVDRAHIPKPPPKPTATIPQTDEKAVKPATEHETRAAEEPAPGEEGHPMSDDSSMTVTIIHEDAPGSVPMVTTIGADDSEGSASSTAPTSGPQPMDTHEDGAIDDLPASPPPVVHEDVSAPAVPPALQVDSHASPHVAQSAPPTPKIEASVTMSRAALASRSATNSPKGAKKTLAANTTASGGLDALAPHAPATSTTQTPTSHTTLTTPRIPSASSVGVPTPSSSASASPPASTPAGSGAVISLWVNMPGLPKQSVSIPLHRPLNELTAHLSLRSKESATFFQSIAGSWEQLDARLTPHELGLTEKQHIGVQPATTTHTTR